MRYVLGFRCRRCGKSRPTYPIGRKGGGSYKRADRIYRSKICKPCAEYLVDMTPRGLSDKASERIGRWDGRTLRQIAAL